jgi:hypothetical protein
VTGGDIGNAYLEAYTKEKVCFHAEPEFRELESHLLIIDKALYGLRTRGAPFHAKFVDRLHTLGLNQRTLIQMYGYVKQVIVTKRHIENIDRNIEKLVKKTLLDEERILEDLEGKKARKKK